MAKSTRGGKYSSSSSVSQPSVVPTPTQATNANNGTFKSVDNSPYHSLYNGRNYYQSQTFGIDTQVALQDYVSANPEPGSLYSISQNLNYNLRTGQPLNANQQFMLDAVNDGMHNIGYNVNLQRYDHYGFLESLGVKNYENFTEGQLKKKLVGSTFTDNGFVSVSYNDFKNAPSGNPFTDREVRIVYKAPAKTQALMPGKGPGGNLGEIVLKPGQNYKIEDIRYTGKMGRNKRSYHKQVEVIVQIM